MNTKELLMSLITKMGYRPELDDDGDINFCFQMKQVYVLTTDDDTKYVSVLLPKVYAIEEGQEAMILGICNKMSREMRVVKTFIDDTMKYVSCSYEFFYNEEDELEHQLESALNVCAVLRSFFKRELNSLTEE